MDRDYFVVKLEHVFEVYETPQLFSVFEDFSEKRFLCLKYGWSYEELIYAVEVDDDTFVKLLKREIKLDNIFKPSENYHPQYYECITKDWNNIILYKRGEMKEENYPNNYTLNEWAENDFKKHMSSKKEEHLEAIKNIDKIITNLN